MTVTLYFCYTFWVTITNLIATFIITLYMYNTCIWNRQASFKNRECYFDDIGIKYNYKGLMLIWLISDVGNRAYIAN